MLPNAQRADARLLIIADSCADELAMRMAASRLYAGWGAASLEFTTQDGVTLEAMLAEARDYHAVYQLDAAGELRLIDGTAEGGVAPIGSYTTVIARPDNFCGILRMQRRRESEALIDGLRLSAAKNEWIEAGFAAAQLALHAPSSSSRRLVLLPGKNYQLEEDTELFEAVLENGCRVEASDLRCYYFLREAICWEQSNFTKAQLAEVAKLPAPLTPAYVHGNGDLTLTLSFQEEGEALLRHGDKAAGIRFRRGGSLGNAHLTRACGTRAQAAQLLGQPQPGDALAVVREVAAQAA